MKLEGKMAEWLKKHKVKIGSVVAIVAILVFAFWYGGSTQNSRGWKIAGSSDSIISDSSVSSSNINKDDTTKTRETTTTLSKNKPDSTDKTVTKDSSKDSNGSKVVDKQTTLTSLDKSDISKSSTQQQASTCKISISCITILKNLNEFDKNKVEIVPSDGWILTEKEVEVKSGESVYDLLQRVCRDYKIHFESSLTPIYNSAYLEGIGNIYEFDCGSLSGWMYNVNDEFPNYSCSKYSVKNGDVIKILYTCDLGADIGGDYSAQNE